MPRIPDKRHHVTLSEIVKKQVPASGETSFSDVESLRLSEGKWRVMSTRSVQQATRKASRTDGPTKGRPLTEI